MARRENRKINIEVPEPQICPNWTAHYLWRSIDNIQHQVKQAEEKARILTNTYTLQSNRAKYNQHRVNDTCQLCKTGTEDLNTLY